jgi:hypothetical protein
MDLKECIGILQERKGCGCDHDTRGFLNDLPAVPQVISERISSQTSFDLVNILLSLQGERVQTYAIFDETLKVLIAEERVGEYPMLCMEITSRFSAISKTIKEIGGELRRRDLKVLASYVDSVQMNEKEKLLIYAAKHMDELQAGSELLQSHLEITPQAEYNAVALEKLEMLISETVECIQCEKVDLLEASTSVATGAEKSSTLP